MPITLVVLIVLGVAAAATATGAILADVRRRHVLARAVERGSGVDEGYQSVLIDSWLRGKESSLDRLKIVLAGAWKTDPATGTQLVKAGYDGANAPVTYAAIRVALLISLPVLTLLMVPTSSASGMLIAVIAAGVLAVLGPMYYVARAARLRQERITRSLPDAMDLLVLCVEAGLGFDAAVLKVAKEMRLAHPDIAGELLLVNRKVNAGVTREEALRMAYTRTGVDELRVLVQHLIQSERLGTSVGKVLRIYGQTLRRRRKQIAEKKAALAPLKMTIPMAFLILPALFIVILGPAVLQFIALFSHTGNFARGAVLP